MRLVAQHSGVGVGVGGGATGERLELILATEFFRLNSYTKQAANPEVAEDISVNHVKGLANEALAEGALDAYKLLEC